MQKGLHADPHSQGEGEGQDEVPFLQLFCQGAAHIQQFFRQDLQEELKS
jgi:hypothetical protein